MNEAHHRTQFESYKHTEFSHIDRQIYIVCRIIIIIIYYYQPHDISMYNDVENQ